MLGNNFQKHEYSKKFLNRAGWIYRNQSKKNYVIVRKQLCGHSKFFQLGTQLLDTIPTKPQKIYRMVVI